MDVTNRYPADELADVRAEIKMLREREKELRDQLMYGDCGLVGDDYVATVQTRPLIRLDLPALTKHLGEGVLKQFLIAREMTQVWLGAKKVRQ